MSIALSRRSLALRASDQRSSDEALLHFIERLPTTIRDIILARCCMAFERLHFTPNQDLFRTFRAILMAPQGKARVYTCAKMAAVVELALYEYGEGDQESIASELLEATGSHRFKNNGLEAPLAQRHWQAACEDFHSLRQGALGAKSLHKMLLEEVEWERSPAADSGKVTE
jgi:hypothetical protein